MIYCPECGTANRDGSKFCNECGHTLLAQTGVKCPHCDTLNAVQSVFCSRCGGRLMAQPAPAPSAITPPIKGLSLPTKPTVGAEEIEQPLAEGLEAPPGPAIEPAARSPRPGGGREMPEEEGEEIPDWLRDLQASLPIEPEPEAPGSDLGSQGSVAEVSQPPASPIPSAEEEELPAWLAELKPTVEVEAPAVPPAEAELEEEELPSWLTELKPTAGVEAPAVPPAEAELEEEELPAWLTELKPPAGVEAPAVPPAEAELEEEELPAWVEAPLPTPEVGLEEGELPLWLAELKEAREPIPSIPGKGREVEEAAKDMRRQEPPPEAAGPQPAPPAAAPEAQTMPGWLSDLAAAQAPVEMAPAAGELPDWLVPTPGSGIPGEEETLARAEIPEWLLALKPRELKAEGEAVEPVVEEVVEQTGVLAGIRDVLPVEMLIAQPRAATSAEVEIPFTGETALIQASRVRLFDEIVTRAPVAAPAALARPKARLMDLLPWWIVCALLIVVVSVPLLLGKPLLTRSIEAGPSIEALYETIESLPGNAQVLVAVDYDPTMSGEMDVIAQSIISHLMDRQAQVVAVSLLPAGPATAESLVEKVAASYPAYQAGDGQRYVNLGYLPGQAAAVRLMGQSLPGALPHDFEGRRVTDLAALSGITSTQGFDLIVELAAAPDTLRWWIEQAGAPYGVPIVAGVSAAVEPMARTYYETEPQQLKGVTGGVPGAASYESLRSGGSELEPEMAARLDSLLAGQVLIILAILSSAIVERSRSRSKSVVRRGMGREQ